MSPCPIRSMGGLGAGSAGVKGPDASIDALRRVLVAGRRMWRAAVLLDGADDEVVVAIEHVALVERKEFA